MRPNVEPASPVTIRPFVAVSEHAAAIAAIDEIFFQSSNTQSFDSIEARQQFRDKWLGRYLTHYGQCCFIALNQQNHPIGYIAGSLHDPARDPIFADMPHYAAFSHVTKVHPAQLHINVHADARGKGVGRQLIEAFAEFAATERVNGVHAITSRGACNIGFYQANGFEEVASAELNGRELVFLARELR